MFDKLIEFGTWVMGFWVAGEVIGVIFSIIVFILVLVFFCKAFGGKNKW